MEIRQLRAFVAIAESGTFTAGALRVHVTQAAISMQIRQLETEIGAKVFVRAPRHVILTEAGEQLLRRARHILRVIKHAGEDHRFSGHVPLRPPERLEFDADWDDVDVQPLFTFVQQTTFTIVHDERRSRLAACDSLENPQGPGFACVHEPPKAPGASCELLPFRGIHIHHVEDESISPARL